MGLPQPSGSAVVCGGMCSTASGTTGWHCPTQKGTWSSDNCRNAVEIMLRQCHFRQNLFCSLPWVLWLAIFFLFLWVTQLLNLSFVGRNGLEQVRQLSSVVTCNTNYDDWELFELSDFTWVDDFVLRECIVLSTKSSFYGTWSQSWMIVVLCSAASRLTHLKRRTPRQDYPRDYRIAAA